MGIVVKAEEFRQNDVGMWSWMKANRWPSRHFIHMRTMAGKSAADCVVKFADLRHGQFHADTQFFIDG